MNMPPPNTSARDPLVRDELQSHTRLPIRTRDLAKTTVRTSIANLTRCLYTLSVQATFHQDHTLTATLWTVENMLIHLVMWLAAENDSVVLEIRPVKYGCIISFKNYTRCMLDAIRGDLSSCDLWQDCGNLDVRYLKEAEKQLQTSVSNIRDDNQRSVVALHVVLNLLKRDSWESKLSGLESLSVLTDPRRTGVSTSLFVSQAVLRGLGEAGENHGVTPFHEILEILVATLKDDSLVNAKAEPAVSKETAEEIIPSWKARLLFHMVLTIFSLALETILAFDDCAMESDSGSDTSSSSIAVFGSLTRATDMTDFDIVKFLVENLRTAQQAPLIAYRCAQCLRFLCTASKAALKRSNQLNAIDAAHSACNVGNHCHLKLEKECRLLQDVLG